MTTTPSRAAFNLVGAAIQASVHAHELLCEAAAVDTRIKEQRPAWRRLREQAIALRQESSAALSLSVQA